MATKFLTPLFALYNKDRLEEIQENRVMPYDAQNEQLFDLITDAAATEWGKEHDFQSIHSYEDFRQRLPLQQYEDIKPFIQRMMVGETNLLWPGQCKYFVPANHKKSSSNFLPVTRDALVDNFYVGIYDSVLLYLQEKGEDCKIYDGYSLWIGADKRDQVYRNLSNVLLRESPFPLGMYIRPQEPVMDKSAEVELSILLEQAQKYQISNVCGRPHRFRDFLMYAEQVTGKQGIRNILPDVEVFFHRGIPTLEHLQHPPVEDIDYHASFCTAEGFFGIQEKLGEASMLMLLDAGVFYEFIPADQELKAENVIPLEETKTDIPYRMVLSTCAGLWRYLSEGPSIVFVSQRPYKFYIK